MHVRNKHKLDLAEVFLVNLFRLLGLSSYRGDSGNHPIRGGYACTVQLGLTVCHGDYDLAGNSKC